MTAYYNEIDPLRILHVCAGIDAAGLAWQDFAQSVAFAEIDKHASCVLKHHHPDVPNWGDMTKFKEWPDAAIDVLVGGTPCQSFSVAGLRRGLDDPRGNLALTYLAIAERYRPRWVVWENVPGALSSLSHGAPDPCPPPPPVDLGRGGQEMETEDDYSAEELHAFNAFLAGLSELGYGWAYRILDAEYVRVDSHPRAVPQRRNRIILVGHSGAAWQRAAAVLFERESLQGHPAPRRKAGQGVAPTLSGRPTAGGGLGTDAELDGALVPEVAKCLQVTNFDYSRSDGFNAIPEVAHALKAEGADASEDGTGRGTPLVPVAFAQNTRDEVRLQGGDGSVVGALGSEPGMKQQTYVAVPPVCFSRVDDGRDAAEEVAPTLRGQNNADSNLAGNGHLAVALHSRQEVYPLDMRQASRGEKFTNNRGEGGSGGPPGVGVGNNMDPSPAILSSSHTPAAAIAYDLRGREEGAVFEGPHSTANIRAAGEGSSRSYVQQGYEVRRLTPRECERLQGFPDDWTLVPGPNGKPMSDSQRYKMLGNSMAVNVMRWVGLRLRFVHGLPWEGDS